METIAPERPAAAPAKPRRVLLWGRLWTHLCNPFTEAVVEILGRKTKAFEVVAGDDPRLLLPESLKTFDAIFFNGLHDPAPFLPLDWKTLPPDESAAAEKLDAAVKQSILDFVARDGKGLAGIEGSLCALRDWKEYGQLMGATYNGHYVGDPISWIKTHGRGRVFYCSLGVQKAAYSSPLFLQHLLAGIQFATGDLAADTTPSEK